jgi:hypothetical protein
MQNELATIRHSLPTGDDGFCRCHPGELFHDARDESDVVCPECQRAYRRVVIEVVVESCEELATFYKERRFGGL